MSIFDIANPIEKAKAAIAEAQRAKAERDAQPMIDAMKAATGAAKLAEAQATAAQLAEQQAAKLAEVQAAMDAVTKAGAEAVKWKQQEETIEEALEHAGISGVDVQIDAKGFAKVLGTVTSEADRDTAVAMVEQFPVTGLEVGLEVVAPAPADAKNPLEGAAGPVTYKVKAGESWWGIAHRVYGDGQLWKALKAANNNPRMIHPGTEIVLPPKDGLKK